MEQSESTSTGNTGDATQPAASESAQDGPAMSVDPGYAAFRARTDLEKYKHNALLLFVAQMRLGIDDIDSFAANALTDDSNDKKVDLLAISPDRSRIVVAQGSMRQDPTKTAEANKASDLNTAVSWMLAGDLDGLPGTLRGAILEARAAIESGDVGEIQIWYVHNQTESANVDVELAQAARTAASLLDQHFPGSEIDVSYIEIGRAVLEDEYRRLQAPILVADSIEFEIAGGFEVASTAWTSYSTAIPADVLRALWKKHKRDLMSPNIRDYLGTVRSERNINNGIKETARTSADKFAIYNNGITVLVNDYRLRTEDGKTYLTVDGFGVVNGGQTTGALGTLDDDEATHLGSAFVMARFVKCTDDDVLANIVRFNNTQNKVEAADFRSGDDVQSRLREEFIAIPGAEYRGARRGGVTDAISRVRDLLPDSSVAQALAAFHGDPNLAYNETRTIWEKDAVYSRIFRDSVSARHIVYCYSLLKAIEAAKSELNSIPETARTDQQRIQVEFFRSRGSTHLLTAAISSCLETILSRKVPDKYALRFSATTSPAAAIALWAPVVKAALPFARHLQPATDLGLKTSERVEDALATFASLIEATKEQGAKVFEELAAATDG